MSKQVEFSVKGVKFLCVLDQGYEKVGGKRYQYVTTATLIRLPERKVYSGAAICHQGDDQNDLIGERLAFKRAVANLYALQLATKGLIWRDSVWKIFYGEFRKAFGAALHKIEVEEKTPF